jgi:hypothetical protein
MMAVIYRYFPLLNALWFQLIWFAAILYQQQAIYLMLSSLLLHFLLSPHKLVDLKLMATVAGIGILCDGILSYSHVFIFPDQSLLPAWLGLLWLHFALALNYSLVWLNRFHYRIVAIIGLAAGAVNYFAAYKLGAVEFGYSVNVSLFIVAVIWMVSLPVYIIMQKRFLLSLPHV